MNSVTVVGELVRISVDKTNPRLAYADLIDRGEHSQLPVEFALVFFPACREKLLVCSVGDFVVIQGRLTRGKAKDNYAINVLAFDRLEVA